jgi:hydroxyethylthiazole kinase-like uncharacterized protein yjeF
MKQTASHLYEPVGHEDPVPNWLHLSPLYFDRESVRAVDRASIEEYGIPGIVLMENAALGVMNECMRMLGEHDGHGKVVIFCGSGNNGGDGYALARHLHNRGLNPFIVAVGEPDSRSDAAINRRVVQNMRLPIMTLEQFRKLPPTNIALVVDAIFGTGLDRKVDGPAASAIAWINAAKRPVLAVDIPSGLDCNTGLEMGEAVRADRTVTLVGLKSGFIGLNAQSLLGEIVVADIGSPIELLERFGRRIDLPHPESPDHDELPQPAAARSTE